MIIEQSGGKIVYYHPEGVTAEKIAGAFFECGGRELILSRDDADKWSRFCARFTGLIGRYHAMHPSFYTMAVCVVPKRYAMTVAPRDGYKFLIVWARDFVAISCETYYYRDVESYLDEFARSMRLSVKSGGLQFGSYYDETLPKPRVYRFEEEGLLVVPNVFLPEHIVHMETFTWYKHMAASLKSVSAYNEKMLRLRERYLETLRREGYGVPSEEFSSENDFYVRPCFLLRPGNRYFPNAVLYRDINGRYYVCLRYERKVFCIYSVGRTFFDYASYPRHLGTRSHVFENVAKAEGVLEQFLSGECGKEVQSYFESLLRCVFENLFICPMKVSVGERVRSKLFKEFLRTVRGKSTEQEFEAALAYTMLMTQTGSEEGVLR